MLRSLTVQPAFHWVTNDRFPPSLILSSPPCSCSCDFWGSKLPGNTSSTAERLLKLAYRQRPRKGSTFFSVKVMLASVTPLIMHAMSSDWEAGTVVFLGGGVSKFILKTLIVDCAVTTRELEFYVLQKQTLEFPDYFEFTNSSLFSFREWF